MPRNFKQHKTPKLAAWLLPLAICGTAHGQLEIPAQTVPFPSLEIPSNGSLPTFDDPSIPAFEPDQTFGPISPPSASTATSDLAITLRTELLSPFVDDQTVKRDNVATQVMEADVRGVQTTMTTIRLQSTDNSSMAQLNISAQGTVSSNTIGYTSQARIATAGSHTFDIIKPVYFDGNQFLTKPAYGGLQARQFPQAVNSIASGLPVVGRIGDRIAWNQVNRRMPQSDAIVVRRVADDVLPEVNSAVDKELFRLNKGLKDIRSQLDRIFTGDQLVWTASSTATSFSANALNRSVLRRSDPIGPSLSPELTEQEAASILISEDGINHLLAKQPLGGLTVSDATLQKVFLAIQEAGSDPQKIITVLSRPAELIAEPLIFSLKFAEVTPLQIYFEDGLLIVAIKFQVQPKAASASQMHLMKIQLAGQSGDNGKWSIALKQINVTPASSNEEPDSWTQLINVQAGSMVNRVPPRDLPRTFDLQDFNEKLPVLRIFRMQSEAGQFRISFKADVPELNSITTQKPAWRISP
ncbi:MAG: hypothetical protein WAO83_22550 [Fuerstiella sp.]